MTDDCIFCKIAKGEMESERLCETDKVISFLDVNPRSPGHTLIIPKDHAVHLTDMDDEIVKEVFTVTKKVESMIKESLGPDAFTIGINDGKAAGQEIPHFHVNLMPRFEGDGGKPVHSVVDNRPKEEITEIAEKIRNSS